MKSNECYFLPFLSRSQEQVTESGITIGFSTGKKLPQGGCTVYHRGTGWGGDTGLLLPRKFWNSILENAKF